jgi:hypothetical protein
MRTVSRMREVVMGGPDAVCSVIGLDPDASPTYSYNGRNHSASKEIMPVNSRPDRGSQSY